MNDVSMQDLSQQVNRLTNETETLRRELTSLRADPVRPGDSLGGSSMRPMQGPSATRGIGLVLIAAVLATAVCAAVVWAVTSKMLETSTASLKNEASAAAKQAVRERMHGLKSYVQFGKFNMKNKKSDEPLAFDWQLKTPVDPNQVVSVTPEFINQPGSVAVSAEITNEGKTCRMTVTGDTAALLQKLTSGLDAKVTIVLDVDQLGSLKK